jgi:LysW-gamma-L-alpha-aminoadipyl-6-phosphate/LysW-L-glutamyl-5-phosphate reductase
MIRVAIAQASGYTGLLLTELLLRHPRVELAQLTSRSQAGLALDQVEPRLAGRSTLHFSTPETLDPSALDAVFLCAEHGHAAALADGLLSTGFAGAIIDLSADFRLRDPAGYPHWYGREHSHPDLLAAFRYGLADAIEPTDQARLIANPGCFASGVILSLLPLAQTGALKHASVTAITGATGSGVKPSEATHFPRRDGNLRAYKVYEHQHLGEIEQALALTSAIDFVPVSGPFSRGIWATIAIELARPFDQFALDALYAEFYANRRLVRLHAGVLPELRYAVHTPFIDIGLIARGERALIGFALDNLMKGAASQAVQNLNRVFGFDDTLGLI